MIGDGTPFYMRGSRRFYNGKQKDKFLNVHMGLVWAVRKTRGAKASKGLLKNI